MKMTLYVLKAAMLVNLLQLSTLDASLNLAMPLQEGSPIAQNNLLKKSNEGFDASKVYEELGQLLVSKCIEIITNRLPEFNEDLDFGDMVEAAKSLISKNSVETENFSQAFVMDRLWPVVLVEALYEKCKVKGYNRLFIACEFSEIPGMISWIEKYLRTPDGEDELERQIGYETPLILVARRGSIDLAKLLIARGACVDRANTLYHETPLVCATIEKRLDMMQLLLEKHALVNWRNAEGYTAYHLAVVNNFKEGLELLNKYNASKELCTIVERNTPLSTAISQANSDLVAYLLAQGVIINEKIDNQAIECALHELGHLIGLEKKDVDREAKLAAVAEILMRERGDLLSSELKDLIRKSNAK